MAGDKCFPQGKSKIDGIKPDSFRRHDFHPVSEGHISKLGAYFDWVQKCSRCDHETLGIGPIREFRNDGELSHIQRTSRERLDKIDAHVQTLPYFTGNTEMAKGFADFVHNCCPQSTHRKGFHSRPKLPKIHPARFLRRDLLIIKTIKPLVLYRITDLTDYSYYQNFGFSHLLLGLIIPGIHHNNGVRGFVYVYRCQFCDGLVKEYHHGNEGSDGGE